MATTISVDVKWKKELFKDVVLDFDQPPELFKAKLYTLTNVPPENQTIMFRTGPLKDDWAPFISKVKSGQQIMLMGNAAENISTVPIPKTAWVEETNDPKEQVYDGPPGITNLENTCYMNASLQCLNAVPEIKKSLLDFSEMRNDTETNITLSLKGVINELAKSKKPISPFQFLTIFRSAFPQFAEMKNGKYMQQDAEEFWTLLLNCLKKLPRLPHSDHIPGRNPVEQLFEIGINEILSCTENPEEPKTTQNVISTKLQCHIQGGKTPTTQVLEGIELSMAEQIEKASPTLNKTCIYQKNCSITRIPYYLTVQFVRFFWKKKAGKNKIVRPVDFPFTLDIYKYCSPELQAKLLPNRITREEKEKGVATHQIIKTEVEPIKPGPYIASTGVYELFAIVSHKGITADGGHYVSWVRQSEDPNDWLEFDDTEVTPRKEDDIKKLTGAGGAQWHIAYMCLYRAKS